MVILDHMLGNTYQDSVVLQLVVLPLFYSCVIVVCVPVLQLYYIISKLTHDLKLDHEAVSSHATIRGEGHSYGIIRHLNIL